MTRTIHHAVTLDDRGFVYVYGLKICRYDAGRGVLEFDDHRRSNGQGKRTIEVRPVDLGEGLKRLTEGVIMGDRGKEK